MATPELVRQYRRAWKVCIALLLLYTPVTLGVALALFKLFKTLVPGFVFAGMWMIAWMVSGVRVGMLRYRIKKWH
jgi:hypothetical protein